MKRELIALLVLIPSLVFTVSFAFGSHIARQTPISTTLEPETKTAQMPTQSQCELNIDLPYERYLKKYIVKKGDTLLSIAKKQLGSVDRMKEIVQLNNGIHPNFQSYNTFSTLTEGWILYLPPTFINHTSGLLYSWKAKITDESESSWSIYTGNTYAGFQTYSFQKANDTKYFGKSEFHVGDCVTVLFELTNAGYKTIAISPQDKDYFIKQ